MFFCIRKHVNFEFKLKISIIYVKTILGEPVCVVMICTYSQFRAHCFMKIISYKSGECERIGTEWSLR